MRRSNQKPCDRFSSQHNNTDSSFSAFHFDGRSFDIRLGLALTVLAFAAIACNMPGFVPTPTPHPTLVPTVEATEIPTLVSGKVDEPTLVAPTTGATSAAVRPTPTRMVLGGGQVSSGNTNSNTSPNTSGSGTGSITTGDGVPALSGAGAASFQVRTVQVGSNNILLIPDETTGIPLDYDTNGKGQRCVIDANGTLFLNGVAYTNNGKHSKQKFIRARWSPDGRWLAYIVMRPDAEKGQLGQAATIDDGLWVLDTSTPNAVPTFVMRNTYDAPYDKPLRMATDINWANDSDAIMITVQRPGGISSILVGKTITADQQGPGLFSLIDFVNGTWSPDGQLYVATTSGTNESVKLGTVGRDIGKVQTLSDGGNTKLWMQNAAQVPDGRFLFLARPSDDGKLHGAPTGMSLYAMWPDQNPQQVTQPMAGEVIAATWSPSHTALAVLLKTDTGIQTKVLTVDGSVLDYTAQGRGSPGVHWGR